ncbi:MAG: hypothetical protein ABI874_13360, partial [Chloroflexota bacterium]
MKDRTLTFHTTLGIALLAYAIYLFNFSGLISSWDGEFAFATTQNLVQHGEFSASQMWWNGVRQQVLALNAEPQSKYGFGTALVGVPLYWLALQFPHVSLMHVTLLSSLIISAATVALLFLTLRTLGCADPVAGLVALAFGLATTAAVYAKDYFSEPFVAFALLGAALALMRYRRAPNATWALLAGLSLGLGLLLKLTNLMIVPIFLAYGFADREWRRRTRHALLFVAPLIVSALWIAYYNWARYGSPFVTGYPSWEGFDGNIPEAMFGLLLSARKGLVFYTPFVLLSLWGLPRYWRRQRRETLLVAAVFLFHLIVFSAWYDWQGGANFGPRFLVPTLPFLMWPLAALLAASRTGRIAFWILLPFSLAIQVVGSAVSYRIVPNAFARDSLPRVFPILGHLALFDPQHIDLLWLQHMAESNVVDWVSALLALGLVALSLLALKWPRWPLLGVAVAASLVVSLVMLQRNVEDNRVAGSAAMRQLVTSLSAQSDARDVVVVGDDALTELFFHDYRGPAKWYALIKEEAQVPEDVAWLFERLLREHPNVWLVTDTPATARAQRRPFETWFAQHAYPLEAHASGNDARLLEYASQPLPNPDAPTHPLRSRFGRPIE